MVVQGVVALVNSSRCVSVSSHQCATNEFHSHPRCSSSKTPLTFSFFSCVPFCWLYFSNKSIMRVFPLSSGGTSKMLFMSFGFREMLRLRNDPDSRWDDYRELRQDGCITIPQPNNSAT